MEWCFVVRCDSGYGEVRVRDNGDVVTTDGSSGWLSLDGISVPLSSYVDHARSVRSDVVRIDRAGVLSPALQQRGFLVHYTRWQTALEYILPTGMLKLGSYEATNDPREAKDWLFSVYCPSEPAPRGAALAVSRQLTAALKKHIKLVCLSGSVSDGQGGGSTSLAEADGWGHPRMWAQYADNHRGLVLVFDRAKLISAAREALSGRGRLYFGRIEYVSHYQPGEVFPFAIDYDQWRALGEGAYSARHLEQHRESLFFTKNADWAQEIEWRLLLHSDVAGDEYVDIRTALTEVCIGDNFPEAEVVRLRDAVKKHGVALSRIFWRNGVAYRTPDAAPLG